VVIVNRSTLLGKPLAMMMLKQDATVTVCHSKTENLAGITREADMVITGVGHPKFFDHGYFNNRSFVIDAGINFEKGKLCGDVNYNDVYGSVSAITPVPGGVGPVTSIVLQRHVLDAISLSLKKERK
jgi:methylenetetrahydrofolate dehydrogenase (NADP+)/methenyltetrahydrofolate cyclohydrolase